MVGNPRVLELLEEMLSSEKTPEEVCRDCPDLLPEVQKPWHDFRCIARAVRAWFLEPESRAVAGAGVAVPVPTGLPQVPGYRVQEVLGRGGMGVVYKAWHERLSRTVALKMLLAGEYSRPEELARFLREAET